MPVVVKQTRHVYDSRDVPVWHLEGSRDTTVCRRAALDPGWIHRQALIDRAQQACSVERRPSIVPRARRAVQIRSIPAVKLFIDGEVVNEFTGALPEASIRQWLEQTLPGNSSNNQLLEFAKEALEVGEVDQALLALKRLLNEEPDHDEGRTLLARIYLVSQDEDLQKQAVELIEPIEPDSKFFDVAEALRLLVEMLDDKFLQNLPASPHQVLMKEGINELRRGRFDHALKHWIDALKKEREYREVARKACVAVFKFLGEDSEVARQYRPAFSSAFYS